jgi:hypothetical protein
VKNKLDLMRENHQPVSAPGGGMVLKYVSRLLLSEKSQNGLKT